MSTDAITERQPRVYPLPHISQWLEGVPSFPNPMDCFHDAVFRNETEYVVQHVGGNKAKQSRAHVAEFDGFLRAGPRKNIVFDPLKSSACIISTGGLCPGLNNVIQEIVRLLYSTYKVPKIYGIRYGFKGFKTDEYPPYELTPDSVMDIHQQGGTFLGTCRGHFDLKLITDFVVNKGINMMYIIGGDGSHRAANLIHNHMKESKIPCVVVGIPKTIDDDIPFFDKTFGFDTAVEVARSAIDCAIVESRCVENGVGIVKLMGRDSGFVARNACLSCSGVDACLIPEVPFKLRGENGLLDWLQRHLKEHKHAVIVMAESAGQEHLPSTEKDATGHAKYQDVGRWLKEQIEQDWKDLKVEGKVFYIDPSYMIRSVPANGTDRMLCIQLAQSAVHAAITGYSGVTVGQMHGLFVMMPIDLVLSTTKRVQPDGSLYQTMLERISFHPSGNRARSQSQKAPSTP